MLKTYNKETEQGKHQKTSKSMNERRLQKKGKKRVRSDAQEREHFFGECDKKWATIDRLLILILKICIKLACYFICSECIKCILSYKFGRHR